MARITSKITVSDRIETPSPMVGSNGNWWHYDTAQKKYVDTGEQAKGDNGVSVTAVDAEFSVNSSSSTAPTSGWVTTAPALSGEEVLWTRTKTTYSDGAHTYTTPVNITPRTGDAGTSVESMTEEYAISTSKTAQPTSGWSSMQPAWEAGKYIWSRIKIVYKNPASTVYTGYAVSSEWEAINNVQIGGRNLAKSYDPKHAIGSYAIYLFHSEITEEGYYTISFDVDVVKPPLGGKFLCLFCYRSLYETYSYATYDEGRKRYSVTIKVVKNNNASYTSVPNSLYLYTNAGYYTSTTENVGEAIFSNVKVEKGNKATDYTDAPEEVQARIDAAKQATDALKNFTDGVFADGVITRAEAIAIATHKQQVNESWASAFANYEKVYASTLLSGTPKTDLLNAKVSLSGAKDDLLSAINTAITDGKATTAEVTIVNNKYTAFNVALSAYEKALEVAREAIRQSGVDVEKRAREEADRQNLQRANQAYEKAVRAERLDRLHPHYGVWSADITYPYNDNVAAVVEHNKVHYILKAICPKGTPPSTGSSSDPYWRYIDSFHLLYSKYVKAEVCEIGDMSLVNGEGSDDYIKFEKLDSDGSVHEYMQIGGEAKTESQLQASSTQGKYISISPQVFSTSGTHLVNKTKTESGNYIAKYTGTLELSAWASPMYVPPVAGGQGTYLPSEVSGDAKLIMTVKSASGTLKYTSTSTVLSVSASSDSGNGNGGTAPLIDYMPGGGDTKTLKFTLTAPADKISISDNIELKVELNRYGSTAPGNTIKASLYGVELYSVVDISKSKVTIAKDRISFFFGRSKYILMNYLEQWVLKIVGNALIQGNLEVSGELTAAHIATSGAVLCGGQVSSGGYVSNSFGKYKAQSSTNSNPRVDRLTSPNRFKVYHTINNTNYVPYITPVSVGYADMPQVVDKQSTYFIVQFYNGSGASHHFAFNYLCLKGD